MSRRASKPVRRAFVFGGGGVLGFAWIVGALSAIAAELGIEVGPQDQLIGTSAGSVMSGLLASGLNVDAIRRYQTGMPLPEDPPISWNYDTDSGGALPPRPGWRPGSPRLVWGGIRRPASVTAFVALSGLLPQGRGTLEPIHRMISEVEAGRQPPATWPAQPTWIVATDYSSGRRVVFGKDGEPRASLPDAVCASCAIPAWYAPVEINGVPYIDGGTRSNASVDLLLETEVDEVFVLAPMAALHPDAPRSPVAILERRLRRVITRGILADVERLRARDVRVHLLTPGVEDLEVMGANLMNPRRRAAVLQTSLQTSAAILRANATTRRQADAG